MAGNKRNYSAELKLTKSKHDPRVNLNSHREYTKYEKLILITSSRAFIITASILTLGLYYAYYAHCVLEATENPFNAKPDKKYGFVSLESNKKKKVVKKYPLQAEAFVKSAGQTTMEFIGSNAAILWLEFKVKVGLFFGVAYSWFVEKVNELSNTGIHLKRKKRKDKELKPMIFLEEDGGLKSSILKKFESRRKYGSTEFEFGSFVNNIVESSKITRKTDFFLLFWYWTTYILFSIVTLGIFPLNHYLNKHKIEPIDFFEYRNNASLNEFDGAISRLTEYEIPYSGVLIQREQHDLQIETAADLFRSSALRNKRARARFIFWANLLSLGFFGVLLNINNVLKENKIKLDFFVDEKGNKRHLPWETWDRKSLFKSQMRGWIWDLKALIFIASNKEFKILDSFKATLKSRDCWFKRFVETILSPTYFFIFSVAFSTFLFSLLILSFCYSLLILIPVIALLVLHTSHIQFLLR